MEALLSPIMSSSLPGRCLRPGLKFIFTNLRPKNVLNFVIFETEVLKMSYIVLNSYKNIRFKKIIGTHNLYF